MVVDPHLRSKHARKKGEKYKSVARDWMTGTRVLKKKKGRKEQNTATALGFDIVRFTELICQAACHN
jgi:hypothetical protein